MIDRDLMYRDDRDLMYRDDHIPFDFEEFLEVQKAERDSHFISFFERTFKRDRTDRLARTLAPSVQAIEENFDPRQSELYDAVIRKTLNCSSDERLLDWNMSE